MIHRLLARNIRRSRGLFVLTTLALATALSVAGAPDSATIDGQVFDAEGRPLAGVSVVLVDRAAGLAALARGEQEIELGRARTDRLGFFRIEADLSESVGRLLVRCVADRHWDVRRYELPVDVDITTPLRERRHAIATLLVRDAPGWRELRRAIVRAGGARTERGRILRTHGLPPETVTSLDGRSVWIYPSARYVFDPAGRLVEADRRPKVAAGGPPRDAS
ncbi:MAG: carboxypeptidase regulatory-like domain-containing protein [Acidobacteria bacterium]|nr:MAG: carboxypeptidase regulatory-like domain-containing protein [Acidobacteriota bacterium]